jgi:ribosomal subunit interface protein
MVPFHMISRHVSVSEAVKENIRCRVEKLARHGGIVSCRVVVEAPHRHHQRGISYNVKIDVVVPGGGAIVRRAPHRDLYAAVRDAFDAAGRQLHEFGRQRKGQARIHRVLPHARVKTLFLRGGFGFLETPEGKEVYFHRNSVLGGNFDRLAVGIRFGLSKRKVAKVPRPVPSHRLT